MKLSKKSKSLSIIIPVLNEEAYISNLLRYLKKECTENTVEIIVVDGGSTDKTVRLAERITSRVFRSKKGRASQMNYGAQMASGDILYFLHVDTYPPANFEEAILEAVEKGYEAGCFQMRFDTKSRFLNFFAWFSRVNHKFCRGGDQSLFITREMFTKSRGFDENYQIYEDTEFIGRLYKLGRFKILPQVVITSARKYQKIGALRLQYHFIVIHIKRLFGAGPQQLYRYYKRHIAT